MSLRHTNFLVFALICLGLAFAWTTGHTQDDAYITFRYSQNLVNGHGPVYNPGEPVEGYSNFLWMLVMAVPIALGLDPVTPSWLLGLLCLAANLWLCFRLFSRVLKSHQRGLVLFLLLLSHDALLGFGTSGMETALNALLWTALLVLSIKILSHPPGQIRMSSWLGAGLVAALCILSRPDGALIVAVCGGFIVRHCVRHKALVSNELLVASSTFFAITIVWLIWKISFYGNLLPNTFYAKSGPYLLDGLLYVGLFFLSYGLFVPFGVLLVKPRQVFQQMQPIEAMMLVLVVLWTLYLVWIGGDFMFFRMWVPVLPVIYLLSGILVYRHIGQKTLRYGMFGMLLLANLLHFPGFGRWYPHGFVFPLQRWTEASPDQLPYREQGKALGELLGASEPEVRVAVGAAGASPYYSGLWTTDLFGLTDPQTAREGLPFNAAPGHRTLASFDHLKDRKVNLMVYRCDHRDELPDLQTCLKEDRLLPAMRLSEIFVNGRVWMVLIPVRGEYVLTCIYPVPHPVIDAKIESGDFQLLEVYFDH